MNDDRRILAWLAIALSILCCAPLALGAGLVALAGGATYVDPGAHWDHSDTFIFTGIFVIAVVAVIVGILFAGWGVKSLLNRDATPNPETVNSDQATS